MHTLDTMTVAQLQDLATRTQNALEAARKREAEDPRIVVHQAGVEYRFYPRSGMVEYSPQNWAAWHGKVYPELRKVMEVAFSSRNSQGAVDFLRTAGKLFSAYAAHLEASR